MKNGTFAILIFGRHDDDNSDGCEFINELLFKRKILSFKM
jgi:hypothetical protein